MTEELFTCDVCNDTYNDRDSLADHMVQYHAQKTIQVGEGENK